MRKRYIMPSVKMVECESEELMDASGVYSTDKGIGYGGVDEGGEIEAESRHRHSSWDDDEY